MRVPSIRANVLAPDDRGFADLVGKPNEAGFTIDTRVAWDWLRARGASPDSMVAVRSSLGTSVVMQSAHTRISQYSNHAYGAPFLSFPCSAI